MKRKLETIVLITVLLVSAGALYLMFKQGTGVGRATYEECAQKCGGIIHTDCITKCLSIQGQGGQQSQPNPTTTSGGGSTYVIPVSPSPTPSPSPPAAGGGGGLLIDPKKFDFESYSEMSHRDCWECCDEKYTPGSIWKSGACRFVCDQLVTYILDARGDYSHCKDRLLTFYSSDTFGISVGPTFCFEEGLRVGAEAGFQLRDKTGKAYCDVRAHVSTDKDGHKEGGATVTIYFGGSK